MPHLIIELRRQYGEILFSALHRVVGNSESISLTVEVREMEKESYFRNGVHSAGGVNG